MITDDKELPRQAYERRFGAMDLERSAWIPHWRELADYILPRSARFLITDRENRGAWRNTRIMDSTATQCVNVLSSGMMSGLTSPARPWFNIKVADPELNEVKAIKVWTEEIRERMCQVFIQSNLYTTLPQVYSDLAVFGTTAFALMEDEHSVVRCYSYPVGSFWIMPSERGVIDSCYRKFQMSRRQMIAKFGLDNCSKQIQEAARNGKGDLDIWHEIRHVVEPNEDFDGDKFESKFKKFKSVFYDVSAPIDEILSLKGYDTFPIMAARWSVIGEDVYGISPAMDALGDIKALQLEQKRKMQAIDKHVNPPMVAPSSLRNQRASLLPGDITYVDNLNGQSFMPAYQIKPEIQSLIMDIQENQGRIKKAFFTDIFMMIASDVQTAGVTATEIQERHEEKMLMMGPILERMNDELLDPLIKRTFQIMLEKGLIPPPPDELVKGMGALTISYESVLAQAQRMLGIGSIEKAIQFAVSMAPAFPGVLDNIDADQTLQEYAEAVGAPPEMMQDPQVVKQNRAVQAQQQKQQQAMQMAQQGAQTAQTLGQTPVTSDTALGQMLARTAGGVAP